MPRFKAVDAKVHEPTCIRESIRAIQVEQLEFVVRASVAVLIEEEPRCPMRKSADAS